jgi:D-sedoheptulose 7-phosphate isomerase
MSRDEGFEETARRRVREHLAMGEHLIAGDVLSELVRVSEVVLAAYRRGNKLILFGNGGSAADAQHLAGEFVGRYLRERGPLPALALAENASSLTAIANDYAYDEVFARQIEGLGAGGDVALAISTSGNSENVIKGLRAAREKRITTVALTGESGGRMTDAADYCVRVPASETPRIQEGQMLLGHILCELVEGALFN